MREVLEQTLFQQRLASVHRMLLRRVAATDSVLSVSAINSLNRFVFCEIADCFMSVTYMRVS